MYEPTATTTPSRHGERASWDEDVVHAILDEALFGHLAFLDGDRPALLPLLFVRVGASLYLHGSTGAHFARLPTRGRRLSVSFEATVVDALVLARCAFSHSVNYRSVIAHGEATLLTDETAKAEVLAALMDKLVPGRNRDARPPSPDELRQTAVLELVLSDVAAKVRTGGPLDAEADLGLSVWAGIRPVVAHFLAPVPAVDLDPTIPTPPYLRSEACGPENGGSSPTRGLAV